MTFQYPLADDTFTTTDHNVVERTVTLPQSTRTHVLLQAPAPGRQRPLSDSPLPPHVTTVLAVPGCCTGPAPDAHTTSTYTKTNIVNGALSENNQPNYCSTTKLAKVPDTVRKLTCRA